MFDSHCHVTDIEEPIRILAETREAGVQSLLCCGYNSASNAAVLELRRHVPGLPVAFGLHPWYAQEPFAAVRELIESQCPLAIGECGLDGYDRDPEIPPLALQLPILEVQLALATRLCLPVTVHSRRAVTEIIAMARNFPAVRGVLHAYSGSYEQVEPLLERGWLVGVGGAMTRPGAKRIRRMAARLGLNQLVFETDSPAIGLEGVMPPWVRPHHVIEVARAFALLRGLDFEEVVAQADRNAQRMFGDAALVGWQRPVPSVWER